jgi:hypothetical protein
VFIAPCLGRIWRAAALAKSQQHAKYCSTIEHYAHEDLTIWRSTP